MRLSHHHRPGRQTALRSAVLACFFFAIVLAGTGLPLSQPTSAAAAPGSIWVSAYYPGWEQDYLPADAIDYGPITHIMHFSVVPNSDGSLDTGQHVLDAGNVASAVAAAHAAGKKILIVVGGAGYLDRFRSAASGSNRSRLVSNLVSFMNSNGYDGIDIDWEPLESGDAANYRALVNDLRAAVGGSKLLTTAVPADIDPTIMAPVRDTLDQINLMTYDYSGTWDGWTTVWHNSAIYDSGRTHPSTGGSLPATDNHVNRLNGGGVALGKIGVGIDWYGYVWRGGNGTSTGGATAPGQQYSSPPAIEGNVAYRDIMANHHSSANRRWDASAQAAYLSIDNSGSANDYFISYDDEQTIQAKVAYARSKGVGGLIIWELAGGYRANQPAGARDPLLQALKQAVQGGAPSPTATATKVTTATPTATATQQPVGTATATQKPASTPTAGASPAPGSLVLYDDAPGAGFWDGSYGYAARTPCDTASYATPGCSYGIALNAWGSLNFGKDGGFATGGYARLELAVNLHGQALSSVSVLLMSHPDGAVLAEVPLAQAQVVATLAGGWQQLAIPLSQLNPANRAAFSLQIHNATAGALATIHVDAVRLAPATTPATPTATRTPAPTSTATRTPTQAATATKTPTAAPTTTGGLVVYDNAVANGFSDWSYSYASRNVCDRATFATSTCSYAMALNPWGAFNFGKDAGFSTRGYTHLEFALHTHGQPLSKLAAVLTAHPSGQIVGTVPLAQAHVTATLANGWVRVAVPVPQLNPGGGTAFSVQLQNITSEQLSTIHVDAVRFISVSGGSQVVTYAAPTGVDWH